MPEFVQIDKRIFQLGLTAREFAVFAALKSFCFYNQPKPDECFPAMKTLLTMIRIGKKQLRRTLYVLDYSGLIMIGERKRNRGKPMNYYKLKDLTLLDEYSIKEIKNRLEEGREEFKSMGSQWTHNTVSQGPHNTGSQIGFNIAAQSTHNTESQVSQKKKNLKEEVKRNNEKSKTYKILSKKNINQKTYAFKDNGLIYCYEDNTDYEADHLKQNLPEGHDIISELNRLDL